MTKSTLDKILELASDELPESQTTSTEGEQ
jgi:hypothetical protein